jgi:peptide/nickel transport system permease protein
VSALAEPTVAPARSWFPASRLPARVWRTSSGRAGMSICAVLLGCVLLAVLGLLPADPIAQAPAEALQGPSGAHPFGTDQFGRDVFSRVLDGVRASLQVAVVAVAIAATVGTVAGIAAGFLGGWVDGIVGRIADVVFAFPAILLALAVVSALGTGWLNTALAIAIVYTPIFVRVARGPVLSLRDADFVRAGRVLGFSSTRLLFRHVLPNVTAPIVVQVALALSWAILTESSLSFLGLGTKPPAASLGLMVSDARTLAVDAWWTLVFPAAAIVLAVIGLNLLGDGLRDALDPRREKR